MIALLQRIKHANVSVDGEKIAAAQRGVLALIGVEREDTEKEGGRLLERILSYRIFPDAQGRMNLDLSAVDGDLLLVPQFTLAANTDSGARPSFTPAAPPEQGKKLFNYFVNKAKQTYGRVACGRFGADMQVTLCNDGPVTFWLQVGQSSCSRNDKI